MAPVLLFVRDETLSLIEEYHSEAGVDLPLSGEKDIEKLSDFFEDMQSRLRNEISEGKQIDGHLLELVSDAFDDLAILDNEDYHDVAELNRRMTHRMDRWHRWPYWDSNPGHRCRGPAGYPCYPIGPIRCMAVADKSLI